MKHTTAIVSFFLFILFFLTGTSFVTPTYAATVTELLPRPFILQAASGAREAYQLTDPNVLKGTTILRLTYDLMGTCILGGDASAIIFDQPINRTWRYISLANFGKNCFKGTQTVDIPLSRFSGLNTTQQVGTFHVRFWQSKPYSVVIMSAKLFNSQDLTSLLPGSNFGQVIDTTNPNYIVPLSSESPRIPSSPRINPSPSAIISPVPSSLTPAAPSPRITSSPPATPSPPVVQPSAQASWSIQSVSSMKETKDRICGPRSKEFITKWVNRAVEIGANYVSIETPYDNPSCGNTINYTADWINAIRSRGLKVWHRHMPLAFEGIYNIPKNNSTNYLTQIRNYILANKYFFAAGDIFTPIPEPQNGGIRGVTYCPQNSCMFTGAAHFNQWLRDAMDTSEQAFKEIGLGGKMKIGYYGFDGFVAWGDNNPDWTGILEDATVLKMGNITIDHYPEIVGDTMQNDLNELERRYPNIPIIIGEWGTITKANPEQQVLQSMAAAKRPSVVGFNYWHMGVGGNEELITETFVKKVQFDEVQRFFRNTSL